MRSYSVEVQINVDLAGDALGDVAYRWMDEVSMARAGSARALVAPLPARLGRGRLGEPGDVFGYLQVTRWSEDRPPRSQERQPSDAGMRWLREQLRDVPRMASLWFGTLDERGTRSGDLGSVLVERHPSAPGVIVLTTSVAESQLTDPVDGGRVQRFYLDLLFRFADQVNPAYGHIAYHDGGKTAFEAGLRNNTRVPPWHWWDYPTTLTASREALRGYAWLTILPQDLLDRVGGLDTLAHSGAFVEVRPLTAGGVWLLATDDYRAFDDAALLRVFHALAPALRPGPITLWPPAYGDPPLRVVPKDASRYPLPRLDGGGSSARGAAGSSGLSGEGGQHAGATGLDPATPWWWTVTVEGPDPAPVTIVRSAPGDVAEPLQWTEAHWWTTTLMVQAAVPPDVSAADAAQVLADAVTRRMLRMRAEIGYTPQVPTAAADPHMINSPLRPAGGHTVATYFVRLDVEYAQHPEAARIFTHLDLVWSNAWLRYYAPSAQPKLVFIPITQDRFTTGYTTAQTHQTSRLSP